MSKALRKHLLYGLRDLKKRHQQLSWILKERNEKIFLEHLTKCQASAICIGEQIEAVYGNDTNSVKTLESYCEQIYLILENINSFSRKKQLYVIGEKLLDEAENILERKLPNKCEVLFLPYKADMWDALESIFLAADRDLDCEAYVMPIPYYNKNTDGSIGELKYEKDHYPQYISVIDYREYDLKSRLPDMIFIHNPYDGCNQVTSVMQDFYASNLKDFTDRLIYIPYFVMDEKRINSLFYREKMKHFCFLPGVIYSDSVIVQSEQVRQFYIQEYMKAAKEYGLKEDEKRIADKIRALGSPKLERISHILKEDVKISAEWAKILQKPNGTRKTVIFYNTSIISFLKFQNQMIQKMKLVFEAFRNKEDIAFLWRPHPLIDSSIKVMQPQLWEAYQEIVERYQREAWGIYDETPDVDCAVVLSDIYYGDPSSVAELFLVKDKKVVFQKADVFEEDETDMVFTPYFTDGYIEGNYVYLPAENYNQLFRLDFDKGNLEMLGEFQENPSKGSFLMTCMIKKGRKLYFMPVNGTTMPVYDCQEDCFCEPCRDEKLLLGNGISFSNCFSYGSYLYFLPCCTKGILKFNTEDGQVEWSMKYLDVYKSRFHKQPQYWAGSDSPYVFDKKAYALCQEEPAIIEINIDNLDVEYYPLEGVDGKIESFCGCDDALYLVSQSGRIVKWDISEKKCALLACFKKDFDVRMMINVKKKIVMLSLDSWKGKVYSTDTNKIEDISEVPLFSKLKTDNEMNFRVLDIRRKDKILLVGQNLEFLLYNLETMEIESMCRISEDRWKEQIKILSERLKNYEKDMHNGIAEKLIAAGKEQVKEESYDCRMIGQSIYDEMMLEYNRMNKN